MLFDGGDNLYSEIKGGMKEAAGASNGGENKKAEEKAQRRSEKSSSTRLRPQRRPSRRRCGGTARLRPARRSATGRGARTKVAPWATCRPTLMTSRAGLLGEPGRPAEGIAAPSSTGTHLRLQDTLAFPPSRHPQPHRPTSAFDRDRELEEGAAHALVGDELRQGQQHLAVWGVPEGVAVFQLQHLPHVCAQLSVQSSLPLLLLGGERRPVTGDGNLDALACRLAVHRTSSLRASTR